jgi:flagellar biosynthesis protein FlhF
MAYAAELGLHGTEAGAASDLQDRITRWNCRGPLVIDTRGCGPRDSWGIERLGALLDMAGTGDERYLVLSATEHPAIARECLKAYATIGIKGVVLTRVDQAAGIGHCLDEVRQRKMSVKYIGTGERVPEDLTEPTAGNLRALELSRPLTAVNAEAV